MVEDLVDIVERIFFVDDGVEEDTQSPDILFLATVGFTLEDFGGGIIYKHAIMISALFFLLGYQEHFD